MATTIRTIQTSTPATQLVQEQTRDVFAAQEGLTRLGQRLIQTSFDSAAIDTRYSCVDEFDLNRPEPIEALFYDRRSGQLRSPSTAVRNQKYVEHAPALFLDAARQALETCKDLQPSDITHVITVSCTGFYNPGPDYQIVRGLGLNPGTVRHHLGFMGCYAAFPALRAAWDFCRADLEATVLVVCAELCTLHVRSSNDPDTIMGSAIFADGAAAAIVSSGYHQGLVLEDFKTTLTPVGEEAMAWNIGDEGFEMVLGTYVPQIIDEHITGALEPLLGTGSEALGVEDITHWAIHPGGRAILDRIQRRLDLSESQLEPARRILQDFGNMSSATVLFVLKEILESQDTEQGQKLCAMAFGPGLTVETLLGSINKTGGPR